MSGDAGLSTVALTPLAEAARVQRQALRDRSYRATPLGLVVGRYIRWKRSEWGASPETIRNYEPPLAKLALFYADLELGAFEPPAGRELIRDYIDHYWGHAQITPRTRNRIRSTLSDFFSWAVRENLLHGNPMSGISRERKRDTARETFRARVVQAIISGQTELDRRLFCRLVCEYGLRRAETTRVQRKHFDFDRRRLTVFGKGGRVRYVPIPDEAFWRELGQLDLELAWGPNDYLLHRTKTVTTARPGKTIRYLNQPIVPRTVHTRWYQCLQEAGVVAEGVESGQNMHRGRHTAGQALLDFSGNLKAVQMLLGHADIATTGNVYVGWDQEQLAASLAAMFAAREEE